MGMKIFNFACENGHLFEGWFASDAQWRADAESGRFVCPICGSKKIEKRPAAPNFSKVEGTTRTDVNGDVASRRAMTGRERQGAALAALRKAASEAEDVGDRFVTTVRAMHDGTEPKRLVRGLCTPAEAGELDEEGIAVMPLPDAAVERLN
ncbi:MAG: DUF1178 domain-containing protein [Burkholderia sp.]|jgi:hypothetical protein